MAGISKRIRAKGVRRKLLPPPSLENKYVAGLQQVLGYVHESYMSYLVPKLPTIARQDDNKYTTELELLWATIRTAIPKKVADVFRSVFGKLDESGARELSTLIGIDVRRIGLGHLVDQFLNENIRLVEEAGRSYADKVREVFEQPYASTLRVEELKKQLLKQQDISKARADLIARDQVLKFNGQINQERQRRAGVTQYVWSTSQDERVRPDHAPPEPRLATPGRPISLSRPRHRSRRRLPARAPRSAPRWRD